MIAVSEAFDFWNSHCVRKPISTVAAVFDRATDEGLRAFTFCEDEFCDPDVVWACSSLDVLPTYDFAQNDISCDVVSVQVVRQCDKPLGSLVKSYADICLSNSRGKYSQWASGSFQDCSDEDIDYPQPVDVTQGLPIQIGGGYKWNKDGCDDMRETVCMFTGLTDRSPRYTNQGGGNELVCFHAVDNVGKALELLIPEDVVFDDVPVSEAITTLLASVGVYVDTDCESTCTVSFTAEENKQVKDYLANLIMLDTGRFYADEKGNFKYDCNNCVDTDCDYEINTFDHIISTERPSVKDVYNIVKVQQFTNPGGVEITATDPSSIEQFGPSSLTITNPLIDNEDKANELGQRILSLYAKGSFERTVEIYGIPQLQVGDIICLKERIATRSGDCKCENIYQSVKYKLCKIVDTYNTSGHTQRLTMDRVGVQATVRHMCDEAPWCSIDTNPFPVEGCETACV